MTSLARRTRERKLAQQLAQSSGQSVPSGIAPAMPETGEGVNEYNGLLAALHNDLHEISDIQSLDARNPVKLEKAVKYHDWVAGALLAGHEEKAVQDEIVVTQMIWALDYGDYTYALDIAEHCLKHGLALPERYSRSLGCLVAEQVAENALVPDADIPLDILNRTHALTEKSDMPDQARAKLMKALGRALSSAAEAFDPEADNAVAGGKPALTASAIDHLTLALKLNKNIGVKKELAALEKELEKMGGQPAASPDPQTGDQKGSTEPTDEKE
ncbi:phage terminase small subunit [Parasphingorhabdus sp. JC815]|uniref:phage terminase small subunit n=1 Tax=Parasphingorhabdus sp. JC815 TaxID=3232140 RepID=UPI00345893B2